MSGPFTGFAAGARAFAVPESFVTQVLPLLDGQSLAAALCALRLLHHHRGFPRYLTVGELAADPSLAAFLAHTGNAERALTDAVGQLVAVGLLLPLTVERDGRRDDLLFLNTPADRRAAALVRQRRLDLGEPVPPEPAGAPPPDVFALYEENVAPLTPLVAQELAEAAARYPHAWLEAAIREAAVQRARSWRYVARILERWAVEGPDDEKVGRDTAHDLERYFSGRYGRILRERLDAERG